LGAAAGTLQTAARLAQTRGLADPDTQAALQTAAEELALVQAYDWTPERIARSPEADRVILERYQPQVAALQAAVQQATTPDAVAAVAAQAEALRQAFVADDLARTRAAAIRQETPSETGAHRPTTLPAWLYSPPTATTVGATTVPTDTARAFDNLARHLATDRGVRIRIRNLPSGPEGVLEGEYLFDANSILLGPAALAKDSYAVQVLAHEAAHALMDRPACHVYNAAVPYTERTEEQLAQYASLIALSETGLPIEMADGTEVPPGARQVDWDAVAAELGPADTARLLWTAAWITDALQDVPRDYAAPACPPTTPPTATPVGAEGSLP
jgi:hypothetical protein